MFCRWERGSVGSGKVFIRLKGNGDFLFLLHNLAAGCWWDTLKAVLGLFTFPDAVIYCIRQNGFDFGCSWNFMLGLASFSCCARSRFVARKSNRICFDVPPDLFDFSSAGWDWEINSFRVIWIYCWREGTWEVRLVMFEWSTERII